MFTIISGLLASASWAVSSLIAQRVARVAGPLCMLPWSLGVGTILLVPPAIAIYGVPSSEAEWRATGFSCAAGLIYLGAYFCLLASLRVGDLSLVTTLSASSGAFAVGFAVLGGEVLTPILAVGLVLAIVGAALSAAQSRAKTTAGAGWALSSGLLFAGVLALYDRADALSWVSVASYARLASFLAVVFVSALACPHGLPRPERPVAAGVGVLEALGVVLATLSVRIGPLAVAGVMSSQFAAFAVLIGLLFLGERPRPHQLLGMVCTLIAATMLATFI